MLGAIPLWLHILGATIWVGSQVMMFAVVVPSLRGAEDASRYRVLRGVTTRFGYLGFGALLLLVLTGIDNMDRYSPADMFELRYGYILSAKIGMLIAVVLLTAAHTLVIGPRLLAAQERQLAGDAGTSAAGVRSLRLRSLAVSVLTLLLSLAILFCAALLRTSFAFQTA